MSRPTSDSWATNAAVAQLVVKLQVLSLEGRRIVAIVGPPGSGKSTLTEYLADELLRWTPRSTSVFPMDGFHFDDAVLSEKHALARKGAPHTYDVGGMAATLLRLRENREHEVAVPVFDRSLEISRASARVIPKTTPLILFEGNYLLLDQRPWTTLLHFYDLTVALKVPIAELERRLVQRWIDHGLDPASATLRAQQNDLENALLIQQQNIEADFTIDFEIPDQKI